MRRLAALVTVLLAVSCGAARPEALAQSGTWTVLPAGPLSPRHSAVAVGVGQRFLVFGGAADHPCPPNAACAGPPAALQLRDGAALDLESGTWTRLAAAPLHVGGYDRPVVVGTQVHVLTGERTRTHLVYDVVADRWSRAAMPVEHQLFASLVAAQGRLFAYAPEGEAADQEYDAVTDRWTPLPVDPHAAGFNRTLVAAGDRLVSISAAPSKEPGHEPPYARASVFDLRARTWRVLPTATEVMADWGWEWDGHRVVNADQQTADGGEVSPWPRELVTGAALDPDTGRWVLLPRAPQSLHPTVPVTAVSSRWRPWGDLLLDTAEDTWQSTATGRPAEVGSSSAQAWVGDALVVWGGATPFTDTAPSDPIATGGVYRP